VGNLEPVSPCAGLLPLTIGALTVAEADLGAITLITPFEGASRDDMEHALGLPFPQPNQTMGDADRRMIWVGQGEALLIGQAPDPDLGRYAAVVDQSDAWAVVTLTGAGGDAALARLVPVDLRLRAFPVGATVRSLLGHMNASITRTGDNVFLIAVFRSMAATLVHDLETALAAVAARG
tara:strand:- start:39240 stop:39776 length:537 start_codon:yes stop_codon:yes gene_type:complete